MFTCECCDNEMRAYDVTLTTMQKFEVCGDCLEILEEDGKVLLSQRFIGLTGGE